MTKNDWIAFVIIVFVTNAISSTIVLELTRDADLDTMEQCARHSEWCKEERPMFYKAMYESRDED